LDINITQQVGNRKFNNELFGKESVANCEFKTTGNSGKTSYDWEKNVQLGIVNPASFSLMTKFAHEGPP
jgi:hypothetical protein